MYLTQSQVDRLPADSKVEIVWTGGNGPHEYTIHKRDDNADMSYVKPHNPNSGWDGEIEFVGPESPYTTVKLLSLPNTKAAHPPQSS